MVILVRTTGAVVLSCILESAGEVWLNQLIVDDDEKN